jgi:hypothetical protein
MHRQYWIVLVNRSPHMHILNLFLVTTAVRKVIHIRVIAVIWA